MACKRSAVRSRLAAPALFRFYILISYIQNKLNQYSEFFLNKSKSRKDMKTEKAYKNLDFLNSKDARTLRILAEYLHPKIQLEEEKVMDTIVIFGSARAPSPEELSSKDSLNKGRSKSSNLKLGWFKLVNLSFWRDWIGITQVSG